MKLIKTSKYARRLRRKPSQTSRLVKQALFHGQETENTAVAFKDHVALQIKPRPQLPSNQVALDNF